MRNWPKVKLNEVATIDWGNTNLTKSSYVESGKYLGVSAAGADGRMDHFEHEVGVTVISAIGANCGRVFFPGEKFTAIKNTMTVTPVKEKMLPRFLYLLLSKNSLPKRGGGQPFISKGDTEKYQVPLPPLPVQLEIVATLGAANDLKKKREEADKKMAAFAPALFFKIFGDPSASERGVKHQKLKEVARVQSGTGFPLKHQCLLDQKYPFFKVGDMNAAENQIEMHVFRHSISEETAKKLHATIFPAGSIVFPKIGAAINTNKKRLLVKPSCVDNNVMVVSPSDAMNSGYLFSLFQTKHLRDFASTGNPPSIRKTTIEDWLIPVPPQQMQQKFVALLDESNIVLKKQSMSHNKLAETLDALMKDML